MIKVVVGGAAGRVGRCVVQLLAREPDMELIAGLVRPAESILSDDSTVRLEGLDRIPASCDVFIDFTNPTIAMHHLEWCRQRNIKMVIGVTGLTPTQHMAIQAASTQISIVYSPNMSIGVNLSFKLSEMAARILGSQTRTASSGVTIQDIHHQHKKDTPSGTALKMGEMIAAAWKEDRIEARMRFSSERVGEVVGEHTVSFTLEGEQLEIKHKAENRAIFAQGAILAAKWLTHQSIGLYDMQDVLALR